MSTASIIALYCMFAAILLFLPLAVIYLITMLISAATRVPYVASSVRDFDAALSYVKPHTGRILVDLGSGDGRIVGHAATAHHLTATGYELNPILVAYSRLRLFSTQKVHIVCQDVSHADISQADVIYIFLFPFLLKKLAPKITFEAKKGAYIISRGFKIPGLSSYMVRSLPGEQYSIYIYRV